jgi:hypothetical protein
MASAPGSPHKGHGWLWHQRRAKAREQAATSAREAVLDRLAWQIAELRVSLNKIAVANAAMAAALT